MWKCHTKDSHSQATEYPWTQAVSFQTAQTFNQGGVYHLRWGKELAQWKPCFFSAPRASELASKSTEVKGIWFISIKSCVNKDLPYVAIALLSISASTVAPGLGDHRQWVLSTKALHRVLVEPRNTDKVISDFSNPSSLCLSVIPYRPSRYNSHHKKLGLLSNRKDHRLGFFLELAQQQPSSG